MAVVRSILGKDGTGKGTVSEQVTLLEKGDRIQFSFDASAGTVKKVQGDITNGTLGLVVLSPFPASKLTAEVNGDAFVVSAPAPGGGGGPNTGVDS